jgi:hypothetical protein
MTLAVLDACILFRIVTTNFLLSIAEADAFQPIWSDKIHAEWVVNLHQKRGLADDRLAWRRSEMERAFPGANTACDLAELADVLLVCVSDAERKDAHVIATALTAGADVIITDNIRDMSAVVLRLRQGVRLLTADQFAVELYLGTQSAVIAGARRHRGSMRNPPYDAAAYIALLAGPSANLPRTASLLARNQAEL